MPKKKVKDEVKGPVFCSYCGKDVALKVDDHCRCPIWLVGKKPEQVEAKI